jgi:putative addiction module component (TIGR02574 family)
MNTEAIEREALQLEPAERAELAQKLLLSLDALSEAEIEQAWQDEAEWRARELDEGIAQPVPANEVRRKLQAVLR